jgi:hypothetical protein
VEYIQQQELVKKYWAMFIELVIKLLHTAEKVVNVVDRIPGVGQVLAPVSGVVRSGIGLVRDCSRCCWKRSRINYRRRKDV